MAKAAELRNMSEDELESKLSASQAELFNLRFQIATSQLSDVARIRLLKREVARIRTLLRERELGIAVDGGRQ
ncbi:MAG: 50S ribosomal protein L29 [Actinomycetota bacterium]|nr:MAG: 50S ribosomal protein L29 [Actinomycetota bacterium]